MINLSLLLTETVPSNEWTKSQVITSIVSATISLFSLLIAYFVLRNAGAKNTAVKIQIEKVYALYTALANTTFNFRTRNEGNDTPFQVRLAHFAGINNQDFFHLPLLIDLNFTRDFEIMNFVYDPFIPMPIAKELHKFLLLNGYKSKPDLSKYCALMIIKDTKDVEFPELYNTNDKQLIHPNDKIYKSAASFALNILELRTAIVKWLNSKGIKDINIYLIFPEK